MRLRLSFAITSCRLYVAADKTVRAPGLAEITARGFQPAATPANPEAPKKPHTRPHAPAPEFCDYLVSSVRRCGQDCPRARIGRNNGARVSTRSNARKSRGTQKTPHTPACACA